MGGIDKLAAQGDPRAVAWPRPLRRRDNLEFSFSGLKTALYYHLRERTQNGAREITEQERAGGWSGLLPKGIDVGGNLADRLHGIGVDEDVPGPARRGDLGHRPPVRVRKQLRQPSDDQGQQNACQRGEEEAGRRGNAAVAGVPFHHRD